MTKSSSASWIVENILGKWRYFSGKNPVIPALWVKGAVPLFLVLGENAGGKSFFRRCVCQSMKLDTSIKEAIHLSMESRAGSGMAWKSMIYGDEDYRSTGENSAVTFETAIRTCESRKTSHILYWDEPDIGMSDGAAAGMGIALAEFINKIPEYTKGVFVTTHSRVLVTQLLRLHPHYIHLGTDPDLAPETLGEWIDRPVVPILPEELRELSLARFQAIQKILNSSKKK